MREVGAALGASEDAAGKRVARSLEKLRKFFAERGVSSTTAIIAVAISDHSVQGAPLALAKSVAAVAIVKGAAASGSTLTLISSLTPRNRRTNMTLSRPCHRELRNP